MFLKNLKFDKTKISFFLQSTRMMCTKFQVSSSENVTGRFRTGTPIKVTTCETMRIVLIEITGNAPVFFSSF